MYIFIGASVGRARAKASDLQARGWRLDAASRVLRILRLCEAQIRARAELG